MMREAGMFSPVMPWFMYAVRFAIVADERAKRRIFGSRAAFFLD